MGGSGSGRHWYWGVKATTGNYLALDIRKLQRDGLLAPGHSFSSQWSRWEEAIGSIQVRTEVGRVILSYRSRSAGSEWQDRKYPVYIAHTPCHFGGTRPWFICPSTDCGRRVAILYGGDIFACRHCHNLAYPCQRESAVDRAKRRADKIRVWLGWEPGILDGKGFKPKGMHWRTYRRLTDEHDEWVEQAVAGIIARSGLLRSLAK
jgi:hypothetical protein